MTVLTKNVTSFLTLSTSITEFVLANYVTEVARVEHKLNYPHIYNKNLNYSNASWEIFTEDSLLFLSMSFRNSRKI